MPLPKYLQLLPCMPKKKKAEKKDEETNTNDMLITPCGKKAFGRKSIAKAVAIVLSGYDTEIAAASVGGACTPEMIEYWVKEYRPPFFQAGMRCPPALIDWWMLEKAKNEIFGESQPPESSSLTLIDNPPEEGEAAAEADKIRLDPAENAYTNANENEQF